MAKINLDLPTGVSVEKTLLTCFKQGENIYIIFDADNVGAMGLPIILVSKLMQDRVIKIEDSNEWTNVKNYLKEIISGVDKEYIKPSMNLNADENFYTQLTLPLASFDLLRNSYKVKEDLSDTQQMQTSEQFIGLDVENNLLSSTNDLNVNQIISSGLESQPNISDISLNNQMLDQSLNISKDEPVVNPLVSDNVLPELELKNDNVDLNVSEENEMVSTNNSNLNISLEEENLTNSEADFDYSKEKEDFLRACENVFETFVTKFKNNENNSNNN